MPLRAVVFALLWRRVPAPNDCGPERGSKRQLLIRIAIICSLTAFAASASGVHAGACPEGDVGDIDTSCEGLWHERNRVLAEHGYCFQKERTIRVFGRSCFPPYGQLSETDRCYVQALQRLERANGCNRY